MPRHTGTIDIADDVDTLPNGQRRCKATANSTGKRCKSPAIEGATVCRVHGGSAPQVRRKARLRLAELVDPAVGRLGRILAKGNDRDAMRAIENVLDRAGYPRKAEISVDDARALLRQRLDQLRKEARSFDDGADVVDAEVVDDDS